MKTLFIIYVILSVLVVLFCLLVFKALKKQIESISKLNADNVAEIKSRVGEINSLTNALAEKDKQLKHYDADMIGTLKALDDAKADLAHTKENLEIMCQEFGQVQSIALTLIKRHNYNTLKGFDDNASWATLAKFIEENDVRRRSRRKKVEIEDDSDKICKDN